MSNQNFCVTDARFVEFISKAQAAVNDTYKFEDFDKPTIRYEDGKRYVRIFTRHNGSRSAWAFVDKETGDVLKPHGWKGPAKNFARGNIFDDDFGLSRAGWTGVH